MDSVTMESLLRVDEDRLRNELRADSAFDKDRALSTERLRTAFGEVLLRYNAAASEDWSRQAMADAMTASVTDMLGLLQAGTVVKEGGRSSVRMGAVATLLTGVICALGAVLLIDRIPTAGVVLSVLCAVFSFAAGRLWISRKEASYQAGLDAETVWKTICRTGETMDRKIDGFAAQMRSWEAEQAAARKSDGQQMDPEELALMGDLLEALYSGNGDYSLRQLKKVQPYLKKRGIEAESFHGDNAVMFEMLPTTQETRTLRPALLCDGKLLQPGRAAEHED
ncbi:MAG: hypothetical protein IKQ10_11690 [Oscillospiraceae bacterium]|nr:hypothetical protein [Oscillospiraceae bacterium]